MLDFRVVPVGRVLLVGMIDRRNRCVYLVKALQESLVVIYIAENRLPASASVHDVIGCVFVVNS